MNGRRKKIKFRVKENKKTGQEYYVSLAIKAIGILFIGFSLYYLIDAQDIYSKLFAYLTSSNDSKIITKNTGAFPSEIIISLLIGYFPGILGILFLQYSKKNLRNTYKYLVPIIIFMAIYNLFMTFYWVYFNGFFYYYNYYLAGTVLVFSLYLFFSNYINYKKQSLLVAIIFFFHAFMLGILLQSDNENRYLYVFIPIVIFSIALYYVNKGGKNNLTTLLNGLFSYLFLFLFVLKRIVFSTISNDLNLFITFSILFYSVFYGITFKYYIEEKKKTYASLNILNTTVFIGLNAFVLHKLDGLNYLFIIVFLALAIHLFSLFLSYKFITYKTHLKRFEITSLVLLSGFVSLVFFDYFISVFFGLLPLLLFLFARNKKSKSPMPFVAGMLLVLTANVIYIISNAYLTISSSSSVGFNYLLLNTFVNLAIVVIIVSLLMNLIKKSTEVEGVNNWFNRKKYAILLDLFFAVILLLTVEWSVFSVLFSKTYVAVFSNRVVLLIVSIFIFFIIKSKTSFSNNIKKWIAISIGLYSIFIVSQIYFQFSYDNCQYINSNDLFLFEIVLHYAELFLAIYLFFYSFSNLESIKSKAFRGIIKFIALITGLFITIVCCFEFDFISVWIAQLNLEKFNDEQYYAILETNKLLPYSIIILICFSTNLIFGMKIKNKLVLKLSAAVFVLTTIKIFYLDFSVISDTEKSFAFITIGGLLLLLSWYYNSTNIKKKNRISNHYK